ncbi:MAG: Flp pilus assembly protein CpaB [Phycisphaerae bacterium]
MNTKALIPLIAGLGLAGLAAKLGFDYVQRAKGAQPQLVMLWASKEDVPGGSEVDGNLISQLAFPKDLTPAGAILEKEKVIGRVARGVIPAGVPLTDSLLLEPGARPGLHVKAGFRAVAVKIDESSGVDNHLQPGAFVDVVGFFTIRGKNGNETIARTLIENVEVAAVGQRISPTTADPSNGSPGNASKNINSDKPARAVVLFVKPETVPLLHLAEQRGALKLSMRGDEATSDGELASAAENELFGKKAQPKDESPADNPLEKVMTAWGKMRQPTPAQTEPPKPAPPPKPAWTTVVWNGASRSILNWKSLDSMETLSTVAPDAARGAALPALADPSPANPTPSSNGNEAKPSSPEPQSEPPTTPEEQPG